MALTITIGGVDKTALIEWQSISITQELTKTADQMSFNLNIYGTKTYQPNLGDEVIFLNGAVRVFAGNIVQTNLTNDGLAQELNVIVKDYSNLLDSQLVSKTYTSMTVQAIIADILTNFTDGSFTSANSTVTTVIPSVQFNYISVSECMKKLVSFLPSCDWYVDYSKDVHFFISTSVAAPFSLTDTSDNYIFSSLQLTSDISQIANDIVIQSGQVGDNITRTEYFTGDGTRTIFPLATNFLDIPTVTVGGVSKTVGMDSIDADANFQVMWDQNAQRLRFTAGNTPGAGTNNIVVTGTSRFPLLYRKQSQASITLYGQKEKIIIDKNIQDINTASLRASAEIAAYSSPISSGEFVTYTDGLIAGQYIAVSSVIRGTSNSYKIQSVTTTLRSPTALSYSVKIQIGGSVDINDILTRLLIQDPSNGNINGVNQIIERIVLFNESLDIEEALHAPTQSSPPYVWDTAVFNLSTWG